LSGGLRRGGRVGRLGRRRNHPSVGEQKSRPVSSPNFTPCYSATCLNKTFCPGSTA
jgi:hypothetical protein